MDLRSTSEKNRDRLLKAAGAAHETLGPWRRRRKQLFRERLAQLYPPPKSDATPDGTTFYDGMDAHDAGT